MTDRTKAAFLASASDSGATLLVLDFYHAVGLEQDLREAMGTPHETVRCQHHSDFMRSARRTIGCFHKEPFEAAMDAWVASAPNSRDGNTMAQRIVVNARWASDYFGSSLSIAREDRIAKFLVKHNTSVPFGMNDARLVEFGSTFNNASITLTGGTGVVTLGSELPRQLVKDERVMFDAPSEAGGTYILKVRDPADSEGDGNFLTMTLPRTKTVDGKEISYSISHTAVWKRNGLDGNGDRVNTEVEGNHINNFLTISAERFGTLDNEDQEPAGRAHLTGVHADIFTFIGWNTTITRNEAVVSEEE